MNLLLRQLLMLPRNIVVALLHVYRHTISPLYGDVCRYYPSCSAYALQSVQGHGVLRGGWLTVKRLARCHPWARGGVDDPPEPSTRSIRVSRTGFVVAIPAGKA